MNMLLGINIREKMFRKGFYIILLIILSKIKIHLKYVVKAFVVVEKISNAICKIFVNNDNTVHHIFHDKVHINCIY